MARPWNELMKDLSPERRERVRRWRDDELRELLLSELRELAGMTQREVADELGVEQTSYARTEEHSDMRIDTLRRIVEALGGELEVTAILPGGRVAVRPFSSRGEREPV